MPRIVSMLPSATEIIAALGYEDHLVARSHECDFPHAVIGLPTCTEPRIPVDGGSLEIDRQVKQTVAAGLSIYQVDAEMLKTLKPDIILTQSQCEVCAVSESELRDSVADWVEGRPEIISLEPNALGDIWIDIRKVADAIGIPDRGKTLISALIQRMENIASDCRALSSRSTRPDVACIEWISPLMSAGNWMPELVTMAGGNNLFGEAGKHSPWMEWSNLRDANPDIILIIPCGFPIERSRKEMPALTQLPGWHDVKAVQRNQVFLGDGNQYFNRPGPRVVESLEILAEIFHPGQFNFGHHPSGWQSP
jgi:iron complex transport system substrate-binding protein